MEIVVSCYRVNPDVKPEVKSAVVLFLSLILINSLCWYSGWRNSRTKLRLDTYVYPWNPETG